MKLNALFLVLAIAASSQTITEGGNEKGRAEKTISMSASVPYGRIITKRNLKYVDLTVHIPPIDTFRSLTKNATLAGEDVKICCYLQQYHNTSTGDGKRWDHLVQMFCEHPTDSEVTSFYLIHSTDLPRWCKAKERGDCKVRSGSVLPQEDEDENMLVDCDHRLLFTTTTESPVYITTELVENGVFGPDRDYIAAVILFGVLLVLSFEVADILRVLYTSLFITFCFLAAVGRLPDAQEAFEWMNSDILLYVIAVTMLNAVLDRLGFDRWISYKLYAMTKCHIRYSVMIFWGISAILGLILPVICAEMLLTPIALALCKLARIEAAGVVCGQAFLLNAGCVILLSKERLTRAVMKVFGVSYSSILVEAIPCVILCQVVLFIFLYFAVVRSLPKSPPKGAVVNKRGFLTWEIVINESKDVSTKEGSKGEGVVELKSRKRHYAAERYRLGKGHREWRLEAWSALVMSAIALVMFILGFVTNIDLGVTAIGCGLGLAALIDFRRVARCFRDFNFKFVLVSISFSLFSNGIAKLGLSRLMTRFVQEAVEKSSSPGIVGLKLVSTFGICSCLIPNGTISTALAPTLKSVVSNIQLAPELLAASIKVGVAVGACCTILGSLGNLIAAEVCRDREYELRFITFTWYGFPATIVVLGICIVYYCPFFFS